MFFTLYIRLLMFHILTIEISIVLEHIAHGCYNLFWSGIMILDNMETLLSTTRTWKSEYFFLIFFYYFLTPLNNIRIYLGRNSIRKFQKFRSRKRKFGCIKLGSFLERMLNSMDYQLESFPDTCWILHLKNFTHKTPMYVGMVSMSITMEIVTCFFYNLIFF